MQGHVVHPKWKHKHKYKALHRFSSVVALSRLKAVIPILSSIDRLFIIPFILNQLLLFAATSSKSVTHPRFRVYISDMAAMATATVAASTMQTANLVNITKVSAATSTVRTGAFRSSTRRANVLVCAAGNPERIDNFVEGAKSDASENAKKFGNSVAEKAGDVERTVKDVGRDMGAKAQLAVDAANEKVNEAGDKASDVGDEVKTSTKDTVDSATEKK